LPPPNITLHLPSFPQACRPLSSDDRLLLWRFRWNLKEEKRALTKVLLSVDWGDVQEAQQGIELLTHWVAIDVADALELLSPLFLNTEVNLVPPPPPQILPPTHSPNW